MPQPKAAMLLLFHRSFVRSYGPPHFLLATGRGKVSVHMHTVSVIFGTRPEAIKLCPLVSALNQSSAFKCKTCVTGQHGAMLQQVLDAFGVVPDYNLAVMLPNQTLGKLASRAIGALDKYLIRECPDIVIV